MLQEGESEFRQHDLRLPELTLRGMLLGVVLTMIFTASNVYLGLKVGLTFSSAIPAAVISMAVLKMAKNSNILENNMVQTQASAAGTLSAVIFVIPGMLMIGYWQGFEFWQTLVISACGGALGVIFTIPLRRAMVVHSNLPYPEGVAAAEILKVGSRKGEKSSGGGLKEIISGSILAGVVSLLSNGFHVLTGQIALWFQVSKGMTQFPIGFSTALLGAGYIVGIASGLAMLAGVLIAWGGFVPYYTITEAVPTGQTVQEFAQAVYAERVRLIGAGAMGVAAVWTLIKLAGPVIDGLKESLQSVRSSEQDRQLHRMDTDMPIKYVLAILLIMSLGLIGIFYSFVSTAGLTFAQEMVFAVVGVAVAVLMGFFVAAACAYMAGLIGSSASPISGISILGVIVSSLIMMALCNLFDVFDLPGGTQFATATAIFTTSIILAIACLSNDNMQDLKTGYLVGATPWRQQVALLLGCLVGALVIAPVLNLLYEAYGFVGALPRPDMNPADALSAPQAVLMSTLAQGIFASNIPWEYIYMGMGLGVIIVLVDVLLKKHTAKLCLPPLAVGMGIYLPPSVQTPLIIGTIMGYVLDLILHRRFKDDSAGEDRISEHKRRGILFSSGLIVGESIMGVILAGLIVISVTGGGSENPLAFVGKDFADTGEIFGLLVFVATIALFSRTVLHRDK